MKIKIILFLSVVIIVFSFTTLIFNFKNKESQNKKVLPASTQKDIIESSYSPKTLIFNNREYAYDYITVNNASNITYIANYEQQLTSYDAVEQYYCTQLINGGFYNEDNTATGLVITDGKNIYPYIKNKLFNGFFSINSFDTPLITTIIPDDDIRISIQTGPLLIENGNTLNLNLSDDKNARRSVVSVTGENDVVFMIVYNPQNTYDGPYLDDLPGIVERIGKDNNLNIADSLNLDGGSASVYLSGDTTLREIKKAGGFFCVK